MPTDKKFLAIIILTCLVVLGILSFGFFGPSNVVRYVVAILGQVAIIALAILIGIDSVRTFTLKSAIGKSLALI